jgi:energy-converting hydrogenase Eha subunit B
MIIAAPPASSIAAILTAVGVLVTGIGGLVAAFTVFLPVLRKTQADVKKVHTIVNQQHTDILNFQRALIRELVKAGIEVPIDQSLPKEPEK